MESINNMSIYERACFEDEKEISQSDVGQNKARVLIEEFASNTPLSFPRLCSTGNSPLVPQFIPTITDGLKQSYLQAVQDNFSKGFRLQDSFLQEMSDQGQNVIFHM